VATTEFTQDVVHILLIGGDRDYVLDMNTDTLIVMVINRKTKQVSLLSIPRDLWVYIPTYGWSRINVAHRIGQRGQYPDGKGPGLLARTIELNLGIPIDHWVRIGYSGFVNVVDELGGVEVVVPCPVNLRYKPPTSEEEQEIILQPGVHRLDGETALRYVRTRRGDTDFGRASRQQQFLKAVWDQFKSPNILLKVPGLWSALKDSFRTDLKLGDVLALAPIALDLDYQRIRSLYIGPNQVEAWVTSEGWSVLRPVPEKIQQVVTRLYAPPAADEPQSDRAGRIQVWNGTSRPQLALIAADQLRWQGFQVTDTGPADRTDYAQTQIVVLNDKLETAAALATALGVKQGNIIQQPDPDQAVDIRVILGQAYDPCR
jgi:LCP family protein required for cell wall assembly